jgi:hypothetical protein
MHRILNLLALAITHRKPIRDQLHSTGGGCRGDVLVRCVVSVSGWRDDNDRQS